jgi:photosystem II stability/assembly factor-like uncharacterized protein
MGTDLFAGTKGGVLLSTNGGESWTRASDGLPKFGVGPLAVMGTNLFAGAVGVFLSADSGRSWNSASNGLAYTSVSCLAASDTNLFAGNDGYGVSLTTDKGASWAAVDSGLTHTGVMSLAVSGKNLFAGTWGGGVFLSSNSGATWTAASGGLPEKLVTSLAVIGTDLFAGTSEMGVFRSIDNGTSWTAANIGLANTDAQTLFASGTNLFAWAISYSPPQFGGVYVSTDRGTSWNVANTGLPNSYVDVSSTVYAFAVSPASGGAGAPNLFAGTYGGGIWRRPLSEMVTSVTHSSAELPTKFRLDQNFPNPFNPSTTIRFGLPAKVHVVLTVYNTLGQQIAQLVNGDMAAGYHEARFEGRGIASGVYFYRLHAGTYVETRELLLLK